MASHKAALPETHPSHYKQSNLCARFSTLSERHSSAWFSLIIYQSTTRRPRH